MSIIWVVANQVGDGAASSAAGAVRGVSTTGKPLHARFGY